MAVSYTHLIWYGGYKPELWDRCLEACEQFFNELASKGGYSLQQAKGTRPEDYRLAYRAGYANLDSPEVLIKDVYKRQEKDTVPS